MRIPQRGDKRELAATVHRNAEHALVLHRTRRAGDLTTRSQALQEIQEALDLPSAPLRIECYDVSHNQGTYQSASMVVFEDGLARKSEYRLVHHPRPRGAGRARRHRGHARGHHATVPAVPRGPRGRAGPRARRR